VTDRSVGSLCVSCWAHVSSVSRRGPWYLLRRRTKKRIIADATARSPKQLPTVIPAIIPELRVDFGCDVSGDDTLYDAVDDSFCSMVGEIDWGEVGGVGVGVFGGVGGVGVAWVVINALVMVKVKAVDVGT
jgi:hypothetical protein